MPRFQVAHLREQGVDLVIVPLDSAFRYKSLADQQKVTAELQVHARAAGLAGTVVPVWDNGWGRMGFLAPGHWHSFFSSLSLRAVAVNINREIYW